LRGIRRSAEEEKIGHLEGDIDEDDNQDPGKGPGFFLGHVGAD
jgi:hypothetical protein